MLTIFAAVYLGGWLVATGCAFAAGARFCEPGLPIGYRFLLSFAAGSIWPLLLIGAVEFTSMAVYANATSSAHDDVPDFPLREMDAQQTAGNISTLR